MIVEPLLVAFLALCGSVVVVATGQRSLLDHAALAIPTGVGLHVAVCVLLVVTPLPYGAGLALLVTTVVAALLAARLLRAGRVEPQRSLLGPPLVWAAIVAVTSAAAIVARGVRVTSDSYEYLTAGGLVASVGGVAEPAYLLVTRQLFTGVVHDLASLYGRPYLASMAPLFALSGLCALVWFHRRATDGASGTAGRTVLVAVLLIVATANRSVFHAAYVNAHLAIGVYTLLIAGSCWLVARGKRPHATLAIACLGVVAVLVARPESALFLVLVLLPAALTTALDRRWRSALVWTFAGAVVAWWGFGLGTLAGWGPSSPATASLLAGLGLAAAYEATRSAPFAALAQRAAVPAVHALLWAALLVAALRDPEDVLPRSLPATWTNLVGGEGLWGASLFALAVLIVVATVTHPPRPLQLLLLPLSTFVPLAFVLAWARDGAFRVGVGDSLNRMWAHVILLAGAYVLAAWATEERATGRRDTLRPGARPAGRASGASTG